MNSESGAYDAQEPAGADEHPARLRVGIIGPGRVGAALGVALTRAGHQVVAVSAVSDTSVQRARDHFPAARVAEPADAIAAADLVLLTVPDDALPGLIAGLAATGAAVGGRLLAHTSGRYGTGVLEPLEGHPEEVGNQRRRALGGTARRRHVSAQKVAADDVAQRAAFAADIPQGHPPFHGHAQAQHRGEENQNEGEAA